MYANDAYIYDFGKRRSKDDNDNDDGYGNDDEVEKMN